MNPYGNMTVTKKLIITSLIVSVVFIIEGYTGLKGISRISLHTDNIYINNLVSIDKLDNISELVRSHRLKVFQHIGTSEVEEMKAFRREIAQIENEIESSLKAKQEYKLTAEEERHYKSFADSWNALRENYKKVLDLSDSFSKDDAYRLAVRENQKMFDASIGVLSKVHDMKQNSAKASYEESVAVKKRTWIMMAFIIIGGISLVLVVSFLIGRSIVQSISGAVNLLSSTSTEIASTVTQHERTATQQSTMVNETTATVDELGASARQSSEQAASAAAVAQKSTTQTEEGAKAVREAIEAMNSLKDKIGAVAEQILKLGEQTSQIGNIANLVKDIASQTNMLALNAAVEAARAGEHGKGFAVVASEVRKLADQSKKSAEQANALIADIQKATNSTIMVTEEGTKKVEDVTRLARQLGELFSSLANAANSVYENAQQVLLNTKQQSAALNQVIAAVNSINTGAKETAAGISQTKIGIEKLSEVAQGLKNMV